MFIEGWVGHRKQQRVMQPLWAREGWAGWGDGEVSRTWQGKLCKMGRSYSLLEQVQPPWVPQFPSIPQMRPGNTCPALPSSLPCHPLPGPPTGQIQPEALRRRVNNKSRPPWKGIPHPELRKVPSPATESASGHQTKAYLEISPQRSEHKCGW